MPAGLARINRRATNPIICPALRPLDVTKCCLLDWSVVAKLGSDG